jgi:hypothetical protein
MRPTLQFSVKLAAFGGTLFDRIYRIYKIFIYPDNPVHPV